MLVQCNCATAASDWGPNRTTAPTPWGPNRSTSFGREPCLPLWRQPSVGASVRLEGGAGGRFFLRPEGCRVLCRGKNGRGAETLVANTSLRLNIVGIDYRFAGIS